MPKRSFLPMLTVLIASGDNLQITTITNVIQSEFPDNCIILKASQRQHLYDYLYNVRIDLAILDMHMTDVNCIILTQQLHQSNPDCAILILTDLPSLNCMQSDRDLPIMDYLIKPYTDSELILTLEEGFYLCRQAQAATSDSSGASKLQIVKEQIDYYIQSNYAQIISMHDVARAMNYSDTHFCRLFKQCFQVNFSVFMNNFRVEKAMELLVNTNHTVKEVGVFCGYRDTSYFIRMFKRFTGVTPSDYRIHKLTMTAKKYNKS